MADGRRGDVEFFSAVRPFSLRGGVGTLASGRTTRVGFTSLNDDTEADLSVFSAYIQDEVKLADWLRVVLGARFDSFEITVLDNRTGAVRTRKDEEVTPRVGLILKPQDNLSLYGSYSETFLPRSGDQFLTLSTTQQNLEPEKFTNYEVGAKWDVRPDLNVTLALFQLDRTNATTPDPSDVTATINVGETRTQGVELVMWLAMRGALGDHVKPVHQNYHIPISNTATGVMALATE